MSHSPAPSVTYTRVSNDPFPVWLVGEEKLPHMSHQPLVDISRKLASRGHQPLFRGVTADRLPAVLATGVDVEPPSSTIFCTSDLEKALDYIRWPNSVVAGVVMVFQPERLERSFHLVDGNASREEAFQVEAAYPYLHENHTGRWRSRLPESKVLDYEIEYGYWIPGNPIDAIEAAILVGDLTQRVEWSPPGEQPKVWDPRNLHP